MVFRLRDRWFFGAIILVSAAVVGLALLWPQGIGRPAPGPFGGPVVIPDYVKLDEKKAAKRRETLRRIREAQERSDGGIRAPDVEKAR